MFAEDKPPLINFAEYKNKQAYTISTERGVWRKGFV